MGLLVDGQWKDQWYDTEGNKGEFIREQAQLRQWVGGSEADSDRLAEAERYHLYVSLACPWAHRVLILRVLKGLDALMGVSVTSPIMGSNGWTYHQDEGSSGDKVNGATFHHELYTLTDPHYTGRVTVPVLWDKREGDIVNNESAELVRMFNGAFDGLTGNTLDFYPEALRADIDAINERVYHAINNGVYKAGFATDQSVYEQHVVTLFEALDEMDERLGRQRYLAGEYLTEADIRLFTTLVRFDAVYHGHFKCNLKRIEDYPHLSGYLRELYQWPGISDTVNMDHIQRHYYMSHPTINPNRIVPRGPTLALDRPHGRGHLTGRGVMEKTR